MSAVHDARRIRRTVLDASYRAHVGHIGSCLSVAEILATLYRDVLQGAAPDDPSRDRFVMSKGHAALALYAALRLRGWLADGEIETFCGPRGGLGVHPEPGTAGVDFGTGSLGQGLSYATGAALAARLQGSARRAYVLASDAECNEGALWEAVMFAAHHRLSALVAIVDVNGQQALGYTKDVLDLEPLGPRFTAFGWDVVEVDGHDTVALKEALSRPASPGGAPRVVLARTIFGKGVSFMERRVAWHYLPMTAEQYAAAVAEVGGEEPSP